MDYLRYIVDQKFLVLLLAMSLYCTLTTSLSVENKTSDLNGSDDPRARQLTTPTSRARLDSQTPIKRRRPKLSSTQITPIGQDRKARHRSKTDGTNSTSSLQDGKRRRRPKTTLPSILQDEPKRQGQYLAAPKTTSGPSDSSKGGRRRNGKNKTNTETTPGSKKTRRPKKKATDATTASAVEARTRPTSALRLTGAVTTTSVTTSSSEVSTSGSTDDVFRIPIMARLFKECTTTSGDVDMETYLAGYTELLSIFGALGPVFSFAGDDVRSKLNVLSQLLADDRKKGQTHYRSFRNMFAYEFSPAGAEAEHEGVDTNRWIHRALQFISGFLRATLERNGEDSLASVARTLYGQTMAPHHSWLMRAATYLALFSVPSKESLMERLGMVDSDRHRQAVQDMADAMDEVYRRVESLYVQYSVPSHVVAS